jgi:hypothetical protein
MERVNKRVNLRRGERGRETGGRQWRFPRRANAAASRHVR